MSAINYHENPAISASGLKQIARSPAHFKTEREPTDAMKFGTAAHCAVLEPYEFDNRYTVVPEGLSFATKEGKAVRDSIIASGKEAIKFNDARDILELGKAVNENPVFAALQALKPDYERGLYFKLSQTCSCIWVEDGTGGAATGSSVSFDAKMKLDLSIRPCAEYPNGLIADLKSCPDASMDGFARSMWNLNGYIQAAFYTRFWQQIHKTDGRPDFLWIAAERKPPYLTSVYKAPQHLIEYGDSEIDRLLDIYAECLRTGVWPGYESAGSVTELLLPAWCESIMLGDGDVEIESISNDDEK